MQSAVLQLEQCNSEKDALVGQVLVFICTLCWLSVTHVLYKCQWSISQLVVDEEAWSFAVQSVNFQGCCRHGNREKSCSVRPTLGFSVVLGSKYRKLPISRFSPRRWTSREWSSAGTQEGWWANVKELWFPSSTKMGTCTLGMKSFPCACVRVCVCVCVCKSAYSCFYWTNRSHN